MTIALFIYKREDSSKLAYDSFVLCINILLYLHVQYSNSIGRETCVTSKEPTIVTTYHTLCYSYSFCKCQNALSILWASAIQYPFS